MSMLDAALSWAARGFRVFPLETGTKDQPLCEFVDEATTDPARIRMWWTDPVFGQARDYNIGVLTSDFVVIDIDVRREKQGVENFLALAGGFDTLTVKTPSGGFHCYFNGPSSAGRVGLLGKDSGLDIRSWHNYVVAPGSITPEGSYTIAFDQPIVEVPASIKPHLRSPIDRAAVSHNAIPETPAMVERAIAYLRSAEPAVEGGGGDDLTFRTAARLRDFGISEMTARKLMADVFNPRCLPPWSTEELNSKIANAYGYGTAQFGVLDPALHYAGLTLPAEPATAPPPPIDEQTTFKFGNAVDPVLLAPRPWLLSRLLMRRQVTTLVGAGSAGKSIKLLQIAAHLAMGKSYAGYALRVDGRTRSIIYNEEDELDELSRRLWAICQHFKFDWPTVRDNVALVSRQHIALNLAMGDPPRINNEHVAALIKAAQPADIGFIGLDPFVAVHQAREEDNVAMTYVMGVLRLIAEQSDTAVAIAHHTSKPSGKTEIGEMYAARGGGAIINSARIGYNLASPSAAEAPDFGIEPKRRFEYVAMGDAKMNLALASGSFNWFVKKSVRLPNGDEVGVLTPYDMVSAGVTVATSQASTIAAAMVGSGVASCNLTDAATYLRAGDPLSSQLSLPVLRAKIMSFLSTPVETPSGTLRIVREVKGGKDENTVVLE